MKKGVPVSPGVAVALAHCVGEVILSHEPYSLDDGGVAGEVSRFERACAAAARELDDTILRVANQIGDEEAAIFRAHRQLLRDPSLHARVTARIRDGRIDAATALAETLEEYAALFRRITDDYMQERFADLRDVVGRITAQLAREAAPQAKQFAEPVVLVAGEVLPSQAALIDKRWVAAILTEAGSATGHAAILARALGIPAVSGLRGLCREVKEGDVVAVDGREGHVYLNPGPEVEAAYRKLQREYGEASAKLSENSHLEAITPDGVPVELLANVNGPADAEMAGKAGAVGVGLYRTEYLFLTHPSVPDEEDQHAAYRSVIERAPGHRVVIRTLDLGGDKQVPYLGVRREANPFMGFRSIRLSSAHPEFFQSQIRAILRAGHAGDVSIMFPMVSQLEEVQRLKKIIQRTRHALEHAGLPHAATMPVGVMVEVPAAALCIEELLDEADFVSIGSNDLIQYLMAADRDNPQVAHLCEPFSPALLRLLAHVIKAC
ncbi:MAG: phosphoenolpyruvate--protein phosphotransferase, partial [Gemmataceae bacterium]|nr:phosphoenolpyruvate--protein phosphotransferase [Gemmataceae bacterium]